jgi:hypothetical protein
VGSGSEGESASDMRGEEAFYINGIGNSSTVHLPDLPFEAPFSPFTDFYLEYACFDGYAE